MDSLFSQASQALDPIEDLERAGITFTLVE